MSEKVFYNCQLFDGVKNENLAGAWFTVDEETGKITKIGSGDHPKADHEVDLKGQYVMPGFFNVHCHLCMDYNYPDGNLDVSEAEIGIRAVQNARTELKTGVTFVRECGDAYGVDIALKKMKDEGKLDKIPQIMTAGRAMSMTGGHGSMPNFSYFVDSEDEMRKAVRKNMYDGAMSIKLMATGGVMTERDSYEDPQLSAEEMHVAVVEAHHKKRVVQAHAEGYAGIQNAIDAGVDSIEHGNLVSEDQAEQMIEKGIYLTPTLNAVVGIVRDEGRTLPMWMVDKAKRMMDITFKNHSRAFKQGVKFTLGGDSGTPFNGHDNIPTELEEMVEYIGMTPFEAYQCSSINSAKLCHADEEYGTLEVGKFADFQVLKADPLADVKNVGQEDKAVYQSGQRQF